ncbi:L-lactate permease [Anaerotignum sp. MB30-C6]|uniref:L-lactate permease n=1 Tax=Anaerotignum sp. MB30-C6 TaxID=3070814 RepID=UPI0027DD08DA|nr:L-lactate permease [Anaerotignum sp. MB30-C6]WMI82624.1 L-lactate permease [Anaerotignum sp. MB30-C6]
MDSNSFLLALTPIIIVVMGVVVLKLPAMYVAVFTLIYTIELVMFGFNLDFSLVKTQVIDGIVDGSKMIFMIWAAFLILNMLLKTGAMDKIKEIITNLTSDRRKQVIIIAFCFGGFLEGVAGAGTPSAIAAPFLVALGLPALQAAIAALVFNGIAASLGAAGLTTIGGFAAFLDVVDVMDIGMFTSFIHFFGAILAPFIVLYILYGKKAFDKGIVVFSLVTGITYGGFMVLVATFVGAEFPTICAGISSLLVAVVYIKFIDKNKPVAEEFTFKLDENAPKSKINPVVALSPYLILLVLLPAVRFFAPDWFIGLGFAVWIGITIFITCCLGAIVLHDVKSIPYYMVISFKSVIGALIAMCALLALSNLMNTAGLLSIIARTLAETTGAFYPAVAVLIGSLGSFVTGTTTGSNILFAPLHYEASKLLNIKVAPVFAAQSAGGALGNMICTNNVVATCTTVGLQKSEGLVMQKVLKPICILWGVYALLALFNTYILAAHL